MNRLMNQNLDFELIWKKIHSELSEEEEALLDRWLEANPLHREYYDNAVEYYARGTKFNQSPAELKKALKAIHRKAGIHSPYLNTRIVAITSVAASILLFLFFRFYNPVNLESVPLAQHVQSIVPGSNKAVLILSDGSQHDLAAASGAIAATDGTKIINTGKKLEYTGEGRKTAEVKYNTLKIPRGGEYFLVLSDSTKVWLNSETTLRYPVQFAGDIRKVELTGEAYFEVKHDTKAPFIVSSGNQEVKVLGTHFNISSYAEDDAIYTTLVEGKVEVTREDNPGSHIFLNPNEQSTLSKSDNKIEKRKVDVNQYIAWKDGRFIFEDRSLGSIMETLSKWYDIRYKFNKEKLKEVKFTGNLERYANFSDILAKIQRTNEVSFKIDKNLVIIK